MPSYKCWVSGPLVLAVTACSQFADTRLVGPVAGTAHVVPTGQLVRPVGRTLELSGRPVDIAVAPDEGTLYVKDNRGLTAVDVREWRVRRELAFEKEGGSMCGIAVSADGRHVYATTAANTLSQAAASPDGDVTWARKIELPGPAGAGASYPCGIALSPDQKAAYVCLSRNNTLALVDLEAATLRAEIPVAWPRTRLHSPWMDDGPT